MNEELMKFLDAAGLTQLWKKKEMDAAHGYEGRVRK